MGVQLTSGLEAQDAWRQLAAAASASLRDAGFGRWRLLFRRLQSGDVDEHLRAPQRELTDLGVRIWVDVADMSMEVAFPTGAIATDGTALGHLLVQMIEEAEDESDDDYDPADDQEEQEQ